MILWDLIRKLFGQNLEKTRRLAIEKIQRYADRFENANETEKLNDALLAIEEIQIANSKREIKEIEKEFYFKVGIFTESYATRSHYERSIDDEVTDNS